MPRKPRLFVIHHKGQDRVIYMAIYGDAAYVLHAFQKKTRKTGKQDIEIVRQRLKAIEQN